MNYNNGKIYVIRNHVNDLVYVGSTTQPLSKRFVQHRNDMKRSPTYKLYKAFNEMGVDNFYIELVDNSPCENKEQLRAKEGHHIRLYNSVQNGYNGIIAGRDDITYRNENKEKIYTRAQLYREANREKEKERCKLYREKNKEILIVRSKERRETHKEQTASIGKLYREANKEKIAEKDKQYFQLNKEKIYERQRQWREDKKKMKADQKQMLV